MLVKLDHFPRDRGENKNIWVATTYGLNFLYWGNPLIPPLTGNPICIQGYETTNNTNILNLKQSHFSVGDFHFELGWFDFFSVFFGKKLPCETNETSRWCTLPKTHGSPRKVDSWKTSFSFWGSVYFQGETVSFREGTIQVKLQQQGAKIPSWNWDISPQ